MKASRWNIYYADRELAVTMGDPLLGTVTSDKSTTKEEAEQVADRTITNRVTCARLWAVAQPEPAPICGPLTAANLQEGTGAGLTPWPRRPSPGDAHRFIPFEEFSAESQEFLANGFTNLSVRQHSAGHDNVSSANGFIDDHVLDGGVGVPARLRRRLTARLASALPFLQAALGLGEHPIQAGQFQAVLVQRCCLWAKPPVLPLLVLKGGADAAAESGDFLGQPPASKPAESSSSLVLKAVGTIIHRQVKLRGEVAFSPGCRIVGQIAARVGCSWREMQAGFTQAANGNQNLLLPGHPTACQVTSPSRWLRQKRSSVSETE